MNSSYGVSVRGEQDRRLRYRVVIFCCALLIAGIVLIGRLGQMQLLWHDRFQDQYSVSATGDRLLESTRGAIFTADGVLMARDVPAFDLCIHYSRLAEDEWQQPLSELSGTPVAELNETARRIRDRVEGIWEDVRERTGVADVRIVEQTQYHPVVEDVPIETAVLVRTSPEAFPHLKVTTRARRVNGTVDVAPHVVGTFGLLSPREWERLQAEQRTWTMRMPVSRIGKRYRKDDSIGKNGIEASYESVLRGARGYIEHRFYFHPLRVEKLSATTPPAPGNDIRLTLRSDFQRAANEALRWAAEESNLQFHSGSLVVLDARNGAVLAAATWPTYTLEAYAEDYASLLQNSLSPLLYRPTQALLPTGSVYKLITATAALEEGKVTAATTFECQGSIVIHGRRFRCWSRWGHGRIALPKAIEQSCNCYFYQMGMAAGGEALARWGEAFGLGVPTGVDLPFAASGQVPVPRSAHETVNLSIGQGKLLCTPLQVAGMCAAFANGGKRVQPHFLDCVIDREGRVVQRFAPRLTPTGAGPETIRTVRDGMRRVVQSGTARKAGLQKFDGACKTGTAEIGELNHAWIAGFAPFEEPKIAFAVVSERTTLGGGAGTGPILARALESIWPQVQQMP